MASLRVTTSVSASVFASASSVRTSTASVVVAASSALATLVAHVALRHRAAWDLSASILLIRREGVDSVQIHDGVNELVDLLVLLSLPLLLLLFLRYPKLHKQRLRSKDSRIIESLDCLLGALDGVVEDESELVGLDLDVVDLLDALGELDGDDVGVLDGEDLSESVLGDIVGDELDVDVGVECPRQVLSDGV